MVWAQKLQPHLGLHPGSRQARGLAPQRSPVMLSPVPIPDYLLYDEDPPPAQTLHGDLPAHQLNQALEVESSGQEHSQVVRDQAEVDYLAGLHTPTSPQPASKQRALLLELSSGSTDVPSRVLRLPIPATMSHYVYGRRRRRIRRVLPRSWLGIPRGAPVRALVKAMVQWSTRAVKEGRLRWNLL